MAETQESKLKRKRDPECKSCGVESKFATCGTFYCSQACLKKHDEAGDKWLREVNQMNTLASMDRQNHSWREEFNEARGSEEKMKALLKRLIPDESDYKVALKASKGNLEEAVDTYLDVCEQDLQAAIDANLETQMAAVRAEMQMEKKALAAKS